MLLARHQASWARQTSSPARPMDVRARAGFSSSSTKKASTEPKLKRAQGELGANAVAAAAAKKERRLTKAAEAAAGKAGVAPKGFPDGWSQLDATIDELLPAGKSTKAVALKTGRVLVLYKLGDSVFCSDVESPAYRYPMHDARVFKADSAGKEGGDIPAAECPLDGCVFDLRSGAPLCWCPPGGALRGVLSALKQKQNPSPLLVHPVFIDGAKRVYVKVRAAK